MTPVYCQVRRPPVPGTPARPGVFLDRDGVIVEDTGYLHKIEDVRYIDGALSAIARLNQLGILVVLVTNQAGIGKGYYGWKEFEQVQTHIETQLAAEGGWLDGTWGCACHPEALGELAAADHPFRKPNPGMILAAASSLAIDLSASWLVGDKPLDIEAAYRAGLRGAVHVLSGYGKETRQQVAQWKQDLVGSKFRLYYVDSLAEAVQAFPSWLEAEQAPIPD